MGQEIHILYPVVDVVVLEQVTEIPLSQCEQFWILERINDSVLFQIEYDECQIFDHFGLDELQSSPMECEVALHQELVFYHLQSPVAVNRLEVFVLFDLFQDDSPNVLDVVTRREQVLDLFDPLLDEVLVLIVVYLRHALHNARLEQRLLHGKRLYQRLEVVLNQFLYRYLSGPLPIQQIQRVLPPILPETHAMLPSIVLVYPYYETHMLLLRRLLLIIQHVFRPLVIYYRPAQVYVVLRVTQHIRVNQQQLVLVTSREEILHLLLELPLLMDTRQVYQLFLRRNAFDLDVVFELGDHCRECVNDQVEAIGLLETLLFPPLLQVPLQQRVQVAMSLSLYVLLVPLLLIHRCRILRPDHSLESRHSNQRLLALVLDGGPLRPIQVFVLDDQLLQRLLVVQCREHLSLVEAVDLQRLDPLVQSLDDDLLVSVDADLLREQLLLEPVEQRRVQPVDLVAIHDQDALELFVHQTPTVVAADGHLAEPLATDLLVVLVEHVVEGLVNAVQVQEYAQSPRFHLQYYLVYLFVQGFLVLVVWEVAAIEDLVGLMVGLTLVLDELQRVLEVVRDHHQVA